MNRSVAPGRWPGAGRSGSCGDFFPVACLNARMKKPSDNSSNRAIACTLSGPPRPASMNSSSRRSRLAVMELRSGAASASCPCARSIRASAQASQSSSTEDRNNAMRMRSASAMACESMRLLKAWSPITSRPWACITRRYSPPPGDSESTSHPAGTNARLLGVATKGCTRSLPMACTPRWLSKAKPIAE